VLRFTDGTAEELRKAAGLRANAASSTQPGAGSDGVSYLSARASARKHRSAPAGRCAEPAKPWRLLSRGDQRAANPHILFEIDPHGAPEWLRKRCGSAYNSGDGPFRAPFIWPEYASGTASGRQENSAFKVESEELDTSIEKNGFLGGWRRASACPADGVAVMPLELFPTLRVSKVEGEHGECSILCRRKKEDDPDFGLVLAASAQERRDSDGQDHLRRQGRGEERWQRQLRSHRPRELVSQRRRLAFGSYTRYKMRFHTPKEDQLIATGNKLSDKVDGKCAPPSGTR
jgi:hypothetical protein